MDIVKSVLLRRGRNVDMSSIEELLEKELKARMDNGWHPGSDAIGAMLNSAMDFADKENISSLVEKSLLTDAWNFIYASNVKLVSACCWFMAALEKYPNLKDLAQTEARNFAYSGNVPFSMNSLADHRVLPFIDAFIQEVLRMYGCLSLPDVVRETMTEIHVEDHTIPKGTMCVFPLEYYNFHPSAFPDPETFRPERFVKVNGVSPCNFDHVATFGFGQHRCPAVNFSKCIVKLFAYVLLRNYDFSAAPGQSYEPLPPTMSGEIWTVPTDRVLFKTFQSRAI
jgi:cytochrome P450